MNGHDDDELAIYGPQDEDEQRQQAEADALADYLDTIEEFLRGTR